MLAARFSIGSMIAAVSGAGSATRLAHRISR
jgi:hypothetical protein